MVQDFMANVFEAKVRSHKMENQEADFMLGKCM